MKIFNYGSYVDDLLGMANKSFSVMYNKIFKNHWHNNRFTANMARNYVHTDWQNGTYEIYMPTAPNPTYNLNYMRVAIKIVKPGTKEQLHQDAVELHKQKITPAGHVDSELLIVITPNQYHRGIIRGYKHHKQRGYLTAFIVTKIPEIAMKRIFTLLATFYKRRTQQFLKALGVEAPWKYDYNQFTSLYYTVIERYSYVMRLMLQSFSDSYEWFRSCIKLVFNEIGVQNMVKAQIKELRHKNYDDQAEILHRVAERLKIPMIKRCVGG